MIAETYENRKLRRRHPLRRIGPTVNEAHALLREHLDGISLILGIGPTEVRRNSTVHRHRTRWPFRMCGVLAMWTPTGIG